MPSAIIVGAGLAGLTAARQLHRSKWSVTVVEARDRIGGRIQTDRVDGFLLDHGFQVYLTGYQTAGQELDLAKLQLGTFPAGALIQFREKRYRVCDPLRSHWYQAPWHALETLFAPVGSLADKLRIASFRKRVCQADPSQLFGTNSVSARERLEQMGFTQTIIERFFRPFFGGIFLDDSLSVSASMMEFVFRTFSTGVAALPAQGMHAIPVQIASELPFKSVRLNTTVGRVHDGSVELSDGEVLSADHVIVATEEPAALRLLAQVGSVSPNYRSDFRAASTSCLYFEVIDPPLREATLVLNGQRDGVINNLCFPNFAQPTYAPPGKSLLSVSTIDQIKPTGQSLLASVQAQLTDWFGNQARSWRHLRTYRVPYALPNQTPPAIASSVQGSRVSEKVWRCGDYCETGSIEGAIQSGLKTVSNLLSSNSIGS